MARGRHWGSFAKGFMDALLASMKLSMQMDYYKSREDYLKKRGDWYDWQMGHPKGSLPQGAIDAANRDRAGWGQGSGDSEGGGGSARGVRNNNPGNLKDGDFAKSQPGYQGSDGKFAKFDTLEHGTGAMDSLLKQNYSGMTYNELFAKYAPASDGNDPVAYAKLVAGRMGQSPDEKPNFSSPDTMAKLRQNIISVEQGIPYERVPDYLGSRGGGGEGEGTPALIDASDRIHTTGAAAANNAASQVHPAFAHRIALLDADAYAATGTHLSFNEVHRTYAQQAAIRAAHERMPGGVHDHPAAPPGHSNHEDGTAGDADPNAAFHWAITPDANGVTPMERRGIERLKGDTLIHDPYHMQLPEADKGRTAQADRPPSNQVASLDDDEAMRIALEQQNQSRDPNQRNMDPATINEQAEQAGHYAFTHSGEPTPAAPAGAGPAIPISPQAGPGGPNPNFQPNPPYVRPQQGPGGPNPTPGPMYGPPPPPTAGPPTTRGPAADINNKLAGGQQDERKFDASYFWNPASSTPTGMPTAPRGGVAEVTRPVVGGDERLQPATDANAPSANAQPAEITRQSNPAIPTNPRFVQIYQPNIARTGNAQGGRGGDNNAPMMGVPNLSWGANPPLDQRGGGSQASGPTPYPNGPRLNPSGNLVLNQPGQPERSVSVPMPPPRPADNGVGTPDIAALDDTAFNATGARKGGPMRPAIPRYAGGGGVMGYASGGATLGTPATMAQLTSSAYAGPTVSGGWIGTPYAQLAPNQQAWADQQTAEIGKIRGTADPSSLQFTMMPDAVWPTAAAPTTPTTVNQPPPVITPVSTPTPINTTNDGATGGTTTGAYQLPDIVAPVSTPGVDDNTTTTAPLNPPSTIVPNTPSTGASDVGSTNTTKKQSTSTSDQTGTYAGFQRGGIPRSPTRGRYAGGGMVTNFAAGGGAPTAAMLASPGWQNTASTYTTGPNTAPLTNQQLYSLQQTINSQPAGMFMGSYSDWLTGANNSQNPAGASRDLTNYYGAYAMPAPAAAAPTTVAQPAPVVTPVSTPAAISTTNDAANGGTTTGAYQLPDVVAPASTPALDTTQDTTTVNPTPKTPTTIVPNITAPTAATGIDQPTTTVKPLKTPSTTATGGTGTSDLGNTDYGDTSDQTGAYAGFSRGGIPRRPTLGRYAGGGGVMGYAAGATVQQVNAAMDSVLFGPNAPYSQQQVMTGVPDQSLAGMYEANFNALTPEQQTWYNANQAAVLGYNNASAAAGSSYTAPTGERGGQGPTVNQGQLALANNQQAYYQSQFNLTPPAAKAAAAAAQAAPAAAAPAPVVAPTLTAISTPTATSTTSDAATGGTTTGAYQLPDIVAPTSTPSVDQTGTTVNPTPKVPTTTVPNTPSNTNASDIGNTDNTKKQTPTAGDVSSSSGAYAGFRRGGVIGHNGAMRYDDGGGVSPAPAGMLPGMGGNQPVPPIYYNPATYAGAGAPVGKGVTATSAPTYVAGAIPTLPMFRGGRVQRYDDGGDVQPPPVDDTGDMQQARYDAAGDQRDEAEDNQMLAAQQAKADAANAPVTDTSAPRGDDWYYTPQQLTGRGAGVTPQSNQSQPPDPITPQIKDDQGNPSNGFISALAAGFHWLGEHLGLIGGAQAAGIAPDPQTQTNRRQFATNDPNGATYMTPEDMQNARDIQDPHRQLEERYKDIGAMEGAYRWLLANGREAEAGRVMASMMHYAVLTSQNFAEQAARELYDGNLKEAVGYINKAADAMPGQGAHAILSPDGKTVSFEGQDLNGRTVWQTQGGAAEAILEHATAMGRSGKLQWDTLEGLVGRYDPTFRDMAKNRQANMKAQAGEAQAVAAARKFAPPTAPQDDDTTPPMPSVQPGPPTITAGGAELTVTPAPVSTAGAAEGRPPPPTADGNLANVGVGGNTGAALAALPAQPTPGNIGETGNALAALPAPSNAPAPSAPTPDADVAAAPGPQAQPVSDEASFDQIAASLDKRANTDRQQILLDAQKGFHNRYEAYPDPSLVTNKADEVAFKNRVGEVAAHNKQVDADKKDYIAARQKEVNDGLVADRAAALEKFKTKAAATAAGVATTRAATAATTTDTRESKQKELQGQITRENEVFSANLRGTAKLTPEEKHDKVGSGADYNPIINIAKAFNPDATYANTPEGEGQARAAMTQLGIDTNTQNALANIYDQGINHSGTTSPLMVGAAITAFVTGGEGAWKPEAVVAKQDAQGNVMRDAQGQPIPVPVPMHGSVRFDLTVRDNSQNMVSVRLPQSEMGQLIDIQKRIAPSYTQAMSRQLARDVHSKGLMALPPYPGRLPMGMGVQGEDEDATPQRDIPSAIMNTYSVPF